MIILLIILHIVAFLIAFIGPLYLHLVGRDSRHRIIRIISNIWIISIFTGLIILLAFEDFGFALTVFIFLMVYGNG